MITTRLYTRIKQHNRDGFHIGFSPFATQLHVRMMIDYKGNRYEITECVDACEDEGCIIATLDMMRDKIEKSYVT